MGNISMEMNILRKDQKGMLREKKNTVIKMENAFSRLLIRLDMAEESGLEGISNPCLKLRCREV